MPYLGLALMPVIGLGLILTGLPAFVVLIGVAGLGAAAATLVGDASFLRGLPSRLINLLENDLLQALPLFVLMGSLLNRLPLGVEPVELRAELPRGVVVGGGEEIDGRVGRGEAAGGVDARADFEADVYGS